MKVAVEDFNPSISKPIFDRITTDVEAALKSVVTEGDEFVVNDTLWYWRNPAGKIRPTVANSAGFISRGFQNELEKIGWTKEPTIDGQTFDAMVNVNAPTTSYRIRELDYIEVLKLLRDSGYGDYGMEATAIFRQYVLTSTPFLSAPLVPFSNVFQCENIDYRFRIGLEFETGNIASSFRAIDKLQGLYESGEIDAGVFVTSQSKNDGAARIWPVSNRNGSFQELRQRNYHSRRRYPHIDISFRPDRYDPNAKYFSGVGLYEMSFTGEVVSIDKVNYQVAVNPKGEKKLLPKISPRLL